jgi:hypothetical protein
MLIVRALAVGADSFGATDDKLVEIEAIEGCETLGCEGRGREEHSGEPCDPRSFDWIDELADNEPPNLAGTALL